MAGQAIEYFNRYTKRIEREEIYGEGYLRWAYETPLGRLVAHLLVKRALFSRWYGWRMNRPVSHNKIAPFIQTYGLNVAEFADPPNSFQTFNQFFYRKLKPAARPIAPDPTAAVFPADGRHLGFEDVSRVTALFVKGQQFDLAGLLQKDDLTKRFAKASLVFSRLCPVDYHRFHFPADGVPDQPRLLPGPLLSVSPVALARNSRILSTNKRAVGRLENTPFGLILMLEVGATNVGSIRHTFQPGRPVTKGSEKGYFEFGGSAILTLFEPGRIQLAPDLLEQTSHQRELYARVGDVVGRSDQWAAISNM